MSEWKPIESVPGDGRAVMMWVSEGETGAHCFAPISVTAGGEWWDNATGDRIAPIRHATHWMPLPDPPK